jgi:predicted PurR-regulated permease PerM
MDDGTLEIFTGFRVQHSIALLAAALVTGFWLFRPFLKAFSFATVIGIGFYPFYRRISRFVRGPNKAALLATFTVLLIFVLPTLLITSAAGVELIRVVATWAIGARRKVARSRT